MNKTIEIVPDIIAKKLAKAITKDFGKNWLVWKFNGDFNYIDWNISEKKLRMFIQELINC